MRQNCRRSNKIPGDYKFPNANKKWFIEERPFLAQHNNLNKEIVSELFPGFTKRKGQNSTAKWENIEKWKNYSKHAMKIL